MDFGKYRYQLNKKAQESRKRQKQIVVKEVKFRPKTEEHDYQFKKNNISRFISKENKVKVSVMFRGRENQHRRIGQRILIGYAPSWKRWQWSRAGPVWRAPCSI